MRGLYRVNVISHKQTIMLKNSDGRLERLKNFDDSGFHITWNMTGWGGCDRCGDGGGEKKRMGLFLSLCLRQVRETAAFAALPPGRCYDGVGFFSLRSIESVYGVGKCTF